MADRRSRKINPDVILFQPHPLTIGCLRSALRRRNEVIVLSDRKSLSLLTPERIGQSVFILDRAIQSSSIARDFEYLRALFPGISAIMLDLVCLPEEQFHVLSTGFRGVVLYKDVADKLRLAIRCVASGGYWVEPAVLFQYVYGHSHGLATERRDSLTQREIEVTELLKRKLSNKEISAALLVSEATVKFHLSNIFSKLGVCDRWSAAELMASSGRVEAPNWTATPKKPNVRSIAPAKSDELRRAEYSNKIN